MQDIATKVEGSQLTAAEFNQIPSEIENAITSTGQTLTNVDVRQLVKAIAIYAAKGDFYSATGTADVIALSPVSQMQAPTAYHLGMRIRFIATADNTGPVTISVGTLGTVSLYNNEGDDLGPGEITTNIEYSATYDGSAFRLFAAGSGGGAALPLFYHAWQDHKLTDASYVRADTFSWQDGEIYYTAYNELVEEKALVTEESFDVVAGLTVKYYRTPKNYKIVLADQADFVSQIYDLTGAAWYYILDEENKRFKLPRKISDELDLQKTYPVVGNGMSLGLYNDNGTYSLGANTTVSAASYNVNAYGVPVGTKISNSGAGVAGGAYGITKDPTKSGIIADLSSTKYKEVQNKKFLYFYVGNTKRKETEINIGAITEALNGKVDVDLGNVLSNIDYVVESYNDGQNWYRVYKSGWVEQGGVSSGATSGNGQTVVFLKPFKDTNYTIVGQAVESGTVFRNGSTTSMIYKTPTSIVIGIFAGAANNNWIAYGQGA